MERRSVSVVIGAYNMRRELPRTVRSLAPGLQQGVEELRYEIIVADNGSSETLDESGLSGWGADVRVTTQADPTPSPVAAMNRAIGQAHGSVIGAVIDGARIASPGIVSLATRAIACHPRAVVITLAFHLGPDVQRASIRQGYDQEAEDELLERAGWTEDPYRLFEVSVLAPSSQGGWFQPVAEASAIFMSAELWRELGGFDERFRSPGGGYASHDLLERAVALPGAEVVTLIGEGTFHQVHGGAATGGNDRVRAAMIEEYTAIRGRRYEPLSYRTIYLGRRPPAPCGFPDRP